MRKKILFVGGGLVLVSFGFIWFRVHELTKHIMVKHPIIEVHHDQEIIFDLLKGAYLIRVGSKDLQEDITFPFSISEHIITSSGEFHFEREYSPQQRDEHEFGGYVSSIFPVEQTGEVTMIFQISMPEDGRLYLHVYGIE